MDFLHDRFTASDKMQVPEDSFEMYRSIARANEVKPSSPQIESLTVAFCHQNFLLNVEQGRVSGRQFTGSAIPPLTA